MRFQKTASSCLLLLTLLLAGPVAAQDPDLFPRPAALEPAVQFWIKVYTQVDTQSGYLHDARNLAVIYRRLPLDRRLIEQNRDSIREDLEVLASGKRTGLTASQQEILALWGENTSNARFAEASSSVRWQLGQSDRFLAGLIRSGAYRAHINQVIREKNLPLELGVLPHVESSFNPLALSSASASGMWQFGRATGQRFMRIDHIVDERLDPYTASYAAMSLLEYNYSILGTWPLALTAYNHGAGGMARAKRELGTDRIEDIIANYRGRAFGFASRNFYPQFLAVLDVENNARQYFGDFRLNEAPEFVEVRTDSFIDAEVFARSAGVSLEQLRFDNPALLPIVWEGTKRIPQDFTIKLRRGVADDPGRLLAQVPAQYKFAVQTPDISYVVERGDSLSVIARRFDTTVAKLAALNQLASQHRIQIGQRLLLPQDNAAAQSLIAAADRVIPSDGVYSVRSGDTLSVIAARFDIGEADLLRLNNISDPHRIYPGQKLNLPGPGRSVPADQRGSSAQSRETESGSTSLVAAVSEEVIPEPALRDNEAGSVNPVSNVSAPQPVQVAAEQLEPAVASEESEVEPPSLEEQGEIVALDTTLSVDETNEQLVEELLADPSDYSVAADGSIEIQASETLGHYAEWLGIRARDIRQLNNLSYREPVIVGERLKLDFTRVSGSEFEVKRRNFHVRMQQEFFSKYRIQDVAHYQVAANDNIGSIARQRYSTPIWLLRQYNPSLDFSRVQIGQDIVFPLLEQTE
ncbi:MAG: LysM peptidoglycan-binding domain-containing protein [Gammaproteobacteria bacterium]|nr:LysM peptidoglycan-binding domain-containing protein [Pseudomonadales bacterium]MCP5346751.1 LysM peptidoglycan-binding domain-containing protein [Pseudomonadales bacterium]